MIIEIEVDSINYPELISAYLPRIKDLSDNPIVKAISHVPPNLAGAVVKHIPQSALDSLVESIVNSKKDDIMRSLEDLAEKKGFRIVIKDISVNGTNSPEEKL